ncbi:MAG: hypothetical protein ABIJ74_04395 [archaeon]
MAYSLLADIVFSAFDFLRGAFFLAVGVFFLFLLGYFFSKKFLERFKLNWIQKAFSSTYFVFVLLLLIFFVWPVIEGFLNVNLGVVPDAYKLTLGEFFYLFFSVLIKLVVVAFVFSVFVLPLEFIGAFSFDLVQKKFALNKFIAFFIACFCATAFGLFIVLFLIPWVVAGALYLLYFA